MSKTGSQWHVEGTHWARLRGGKTCVKCVKTKHESKHRNADNELDCDKELLKKPKQTTWEEYTEEKEWGWGFAGGRRHGGRWPSSASVLNLCSYQYSGCPGISLGRSQRSWSPFSQPVLMLFDTGFEAVVFLSCSLFYCLFFPTPACSACVLCFNVTFWRIESQNQWRKRWMCWVDNNVGYLT